MKTPSTIAFDRRFQIWSYIVSHAQLLLRNVETAEPEARIDILFKNVGMICLSASLDGIEIEEVDTANVGLNGKELFLPGRKVFRVNSKDQTGFVVAGAIACHEDHGGYDEPSALLPS